MESLAFVSHEFRELFEFHEFNCTPHPQHPPHPLYPPHPLHPLGKTPHSITTRGYDFGIFAGPGTTLISPFTTQNNRTDEYNGMIIQAGIAAFLESNVASFGFAAGVDYLMNSDREVWIYTNKPWVGFIVGIALN